MNAETWEIDAYRSVGSLKFGMSATEIQQALGKPESVHQQRDGLPKFEYLSGAIAVSLNPASKGVDSVAFCNRMGCLGPSLHGKRLLGMEWDRAVRSLTEWGYDIVPFDAGFDCFDLGVSLSSEEDEDGRQVVGVVIVWAKGYLEPEK